MNNLPFSTLILLREGLELLVQKDPTRMDAKLLLGDVEYQIHVRRIIEQRTGAK